MSEQTEPINWKQTLQHQIQLIQNSENWIQEIRNIRLLSYMLESYKDKEYYNKLEEDEDKYQETINNTAFTRNQNQTNQETWEYMMQKFSALIDLMKRKGLLTKKKIDV